MNLMTRIFGRGDAAPAADEKFARAMSLTQEVREAVKEVSKDPFRVIALDLARAVFVDGADPALVADAYEARQEARIFLGEKDRPQ